VCATARRGTSAATTTRPAEYNYLREADYCSAPASRFPRRCGVRWAVRRTLQAGLLRGHGSRVRGTRGGRRVYYQPAATVVHFEGQTSGTDPGAGVKQHQETNRHAFREKWAPCSSRTGATASSRARTRPSCDAARAGDRGLHADTRPGLGVGAHARDARAGDRGGREGDLRGRQPRVPASLHDRSADARRRGGLRAYESSIAACSIAGAASSTSRSSRATTSR